MADSSTRPTTVRKRCSDPTCEAPSRTRGLCNRHYLVAHRRGFDDATPPDLPGEAWRPIPGHEGSYEVSNLGRVRSVARVMEDVTGRRRRFRSQILETWPVGKPGHRAVRLGNGVVSQLVHRLVLMAFVGPCPEGMEGCHNNGDPVDNRLSNLRWDTSSSNSRDMRKHGTDPHLNRTHCPRGHQLMLPNLKKALWENHGYRECLACARSNNMKHHYERTRGKGVVTFDFEATADKYYEQIMKS